MSNELLLLLNQLVMPNGRVMDGLYGGAQANIRLTIMRLATGNPKLPKSQCGANAVFESLCALAGVDHNYSHAGRESQLVKWIQANHPKKNQDEVLNT